MVQTHTTFTDIGLRRLPIPPAGTVYHWDSVQKGLGLRIGAGGAKTFVVLIASGRRKALGRFPLLSLQEARRAAAHILAEITLGKVHPLNTAFEDVVADFLSSSAQVNKARTTADYTRLLNRHFNYGRKSITDVTAKDILARVKALSATPSEKHHAFTAARALFRFAVRNHYLDRSPMELMETPYNGKNRERVLTDDELAKVYQAASQMPHPFGPLACLLILLGQRRGELAALRWEWMPDDFSTIHFPQGFKKNKLEHLLPLPPLARAILTDVPRTTEYVFPATRSHVRGIPTTHYNGWTKDVPALRMLSGVSGFTPHDWRRTLASTMPRLGVSQTTTEKLLSHTTGGSQSHIALVYNRYMFQAEQLDALTRYQDHLEALLKRA